MYGLVAFNRGFWLYRYWRFLCSLWNVTWGHTVLPTYNAVQIQITPPVTLSTKQRLQSVMSTSILVEVQLGEDKPHSCLFYLLRYCDFFPFFFIKKYFFIDCLFVPDLVCSLRDLSVAVRGISSCHMWNLVLWPKDRTRAPNIGRGES